MLSLFSSPQLHVVDIAGVLGHGNTLPVGKFDERRFKSCHEQTTCDGRRGCIDYGQQLRKSHGLAAHTVILNPAGQP